MRSIAEIDRDFAGMKNLCERVSHGCDYPNCNCSRKGAVPIPKQTALSFSTSTLHPTDFVVINERSGQRWRGTTDGEFVRETPSAISPPMPATHTQQEKNHG